MKHSATGICKVYPCIRNGEQDGLFSPFQSAVEVEGLFIMNGAMEIYFMEFCTLAKATGRCLRHGSAAKKCPRTKAAAHLRKHAASSENMQVY